MYPLERARNVIAGGPDGEATESVLEQMEIDMAPAAGSAET